MRTLSWLGEKGYGPASKSVGIGHGRPDVSQRRSSDTIPRDSDSLCIIHFQAVAKDPAGKDYSFPVRYVFLRDNFMSAAKGHPVYMDMVTGSPTMTTDEVQKLKTYCDENSHDLYVYYAGVASPIDSNGIL